MSDSAEELWQALGPWYRADLEDPAHPLLDLCEALVGGLQPIEDVIRDDEDGNPGWSIILDPDRSPTREWLIWLSQLAGLGGHKHDTLTDAEFRLHIKQKHIQTRGTALSIRDAAAEYLTGTKTVYMQERMGSAYQLRIATLTSETPDAAALLAAIQAQKPAGIVLTVVQISGPTYLALATTHSTYNALTTFANYAEIPTNPTKP